ncbi:MAG: DUF6677 family protein [Phycisphaerales bacterium]
MSEPPADPSSPDRFQPVAALLSVVFPGAGHAYLGYVHRAVLIGVGVLGLFFGGVLVGGIDSIDANEDRIWFIGQALVGPTAFGVNHVNQTFFKGWALDPRTNRSVLRAPRPGEGIALEEMAPGRTRRVITASGTPPITKSLGRASELGTLMAALAGMMNLLVIIDAAYSCRRSEAGAGRAAGAAA